MDVICDVAEQKRYHRSLGYCLSQAKGRAISTLQDLNSLCACYAAGASRDYETISRSAHTAAFEMITYAEICADLGARPFAECALMIENGRDMQARALEHEVLHYAGALSPSGVFYDDLADMSLLEGQHSVEFTSPQLSMGSSTAHEESLAAELAA